jgi:ABC-2 type transport system ATP-binding protein
MISTRNLTRRFVDFVAVNRVTLEVAQGAICVFLGPNGAGKSTTLKMLTGLLPVTSGNVTVCGLDVTANPLEHGRHTFAAACSHGMRKKTAFAMALLPSPRALFLDEPFEAIDPVTSKVMRDLLLSVARHGVTVFLTSHILSVVDQIATH